MKEAEARLAICVLLRKEGKLAFVLRSNTGWMNNHYGLIGGKVHQGETYTAAAVREAKEEAGVVIDPANLKAVLAIHRNEDDSDKEHWVDLFFEATQWDGEVYNAEPDVHGELIWMDPAKLPKNMVPMVEFALENIAQGTTFAEFGWEKN